MVMHHTYPTYRQIVVEDGARVVTVEHDAGSNSFTFQMRRLDVLGLNPDYEPHEPVMCAEQGAMMLWTALTYALFGTNNGCEINFTSELFDEYGHATTEGRETMRRMRDHLNDYWPDLRSE